MASDVLVVGATGRVGTALIRLLPEHGLTVAGVHREVDVCDEAQLTARLEQVEPRVVVYAAAIADPDRCERNPSASHDANVVGADRVCAAAARTGCRVVYYSSDYVFGAPGRYFEDAAVSPLQVYGRHKAEAERLVLNRDDNVVIRLPLLFGDRDFVAEAVRAVANGTPLGRDNRRRYPIPLRHVVDVTVAMITTDASPGVYHAVGSDAVTKSEWACYIAGLLGEPVPPPAVSAEQAAAPRPVDVELATRHPELCTPPGTLWTATRDRVTELVRASTG